MASEASKTAPPAPLPEDQRSTQPPQDGPHGPEVVAYRLTRSAPPLVCAPGTRDWMDATPERFAYRCLPLLIANQAGWFVLNEHPFEVMWDGTTELNGVQFRHLPEGTGTVSSHFGSGVVTWSMGYLFRTPPGYNLLVRGPANSPKDGVQPLEGLVETDWTPASFTMNWKITRPDHWVRFEKGEPICMLVPQRRGELETFRAQVKELSENPELARSNREWSESRAKFLAALREPGSEASDMGWQKHYFQGRSPGQPSTRDHQTAITLAPFVAPDDPPARPAVADRASGIPAEDTPISARRPRRKASYYMTKRDGDALLSHPTWAKALTLNDTAAVIWELCDGERTTAEIIELLQGAFPEAAATLGDEVETTLRMFAERDVLLFV